MADSRIFGHTFNVIGKALDVSAKRHTLIAGNIANMDTIGYHPRDLDFNQTLKRAMGTGEAAVEKEQGILDRTHINHLSTSEDEAGFSMNGEFSDEVDIYHLDTVNIDTEMMNLTENNIKYRTTTELLLRKVKILQYSIDEGGK